MSKLTTYKLSAGSIPIGRDVNITGQHLYVEDGTTVKFEFKDFYDKRNRINIPIYIPNEHYYELYNWTQTGITFNYFAEQDFFSATNYLYSGYYSTIDRPAITANHKVESFNPFKIKKLNNKWTILSSNDFYPDIPAALYFEDAGTNAAIEDITTWTNLSAGNNDPGLVAKRFREGNNLSKIFADYGDGTTESVPLSFCNKLLNPFDNRYDPVTGFGTPAFYVPKEPWSHTYSSFNNSVSSAAKFEFVYENGYKINYNFAVYKSNPNLLDDNISVVGAQSFHSEEDSTLLQMNDEEGTIINAIQTDKIDTSDSSGSGILWLYLTNYADTFYNGSYPNSFVHVATASNNFKSNDGDTQNQVLTALTIDDKLAKSLTEYSGLSGSSQVIAGILFNGVNKKFDESINFNEFSEYLNN